MTMLRNILHIICWLMFLHICTGCLTSVPPPKTPAAKKLSKKDDSPQPTIQYAPLPAQFFIQGHQRVLPGKAIDVYLQTAIAGDVEIRLYRCDAPLQLLSSLTTLEMVKLPIEVRQALVAAKKQHRYWESSTDAVPYGEFTLLDRFHRHIVASDQSWQKQKITLAALPSGIYVIEAKLGPQVAHLPVVVTNIVSQSFATAKGKLLWLLDAKTQQVVSGYSLMYGMKKWHKLVVANTGIVEIPLSAPNWVLALTPQPYYNLLTSKSINSPLSCPQLEIADAIPDKSTAYLHLADNKNAIECGTTAKISLWSATVDGEAAVTIAALSPSNTWELVDQQQRLCKQGQAQFFYTPPSCGWYRVRSANCQLRFYVYQMRMPVPHTLLLQSKVQSGNTITLLVPGKKQPQIVVLQDANILLDYRYFPPFSGNRRVHFSVPLHYEQLQVATIYYWQQQWIKENWLPAVTSKQLLLDVPRQVVSTEPVSISATMNDKALEYEFAVWTEKIPPTTSQFCRQTLATTEVKAQAITIPELYRTWAQKHILGDYSEALAAYRNKKYMHALRLCHKILHLAPNDQNSLRLLTTIVEDIGQRNDSGLPTLDLLQCLEQQVVLPPNLSLQDFFAAISQQTGVYLEVSPHVFEVVPVKLQYVTNIPQTGDALSLLEYVLGQRGLVYKIEQATVFITDKTKDLSQPLLSALDNTIDKQLSLLPQATASMAIPSQRACKWYRGPSLQHKLQFPSPGIWCVNVLARSKTQQVVRAQKWVLALPAGN